MSIEYFAPCGTGRSCLSWGLTNTKVNGIKIKLPTATHNLYNGPNAVGLTYRIYSGGTCANPGTQVAAFKCRNQEVHYAYTSLTNGANYIVKVLYEQPQNPTVLLKCTPLTMGYNNNLPCNNSPE